MTAKQEQLRAWKKKHDGMQLFTSPVRCFVIAFFPDPKDNFLGDNS